MSELLLGIDKDVEDGDERGGLGAVGLGLDSIGQINPKGFSNALDGN